MVAIDKLKDKNPDYFEGVLQLRDCSDEIVSWVLNIVKKEGRARIAKNKKVRGGRDLYFSDQHYLQRIGKKLKETFPGTLKKSSKLFTVSRATGKEVHRVNIVFRCLPFRIGQSFMFDEEEVRIMSVDKKMAVLRTKSGKRLVVNLDTLLYKLRSSK